MHEPITEVSRRETGDRKLENCLTCGRKTEMPVVEIVLHPTANPERRSRLLVCGPHCVRCASRHRRGVLPAHPYWFRTDADRPARRKGA